MAGGFLDPFGIGDGVSIGPNGISRPSKRARSRSRVDKKRRSRSRSRSSSRDRRHHRRDRDRGLGASLGAGLSSFFADDDKSYRKHGGSKSSFFGFGDDYKKHSASRSGFFGLGENRSRGSFFGSSKPSYYKRSSRQGFLQRSYKQLKRLLRDLVHWAKKRPFKVFFLVLMPLISGGILTALLARFGLRMPPSLERLLGVCGKAVTGDAGGLVGEAVRMAGDYTGYGNQGSHGGGYGGYGAGGYGGSGSARVRVHDGNRNMAWEKSYRTNNHNDGWGDAVAGMAKMFI